MPLLERALALLLGTSLLSAPVSAAVCGNGIIEDFEACDDGTTNGTDGCCSATCTIVDANPNGICDSLERCQDTALAFGADGHRSSLSLSGLASATGAGVMRFRGVATTPALPLDLETEGLQVTLGGEFFYTIVFGTVVPGGSGWKRLAAGGWSYVDPSGQAGGVTRVTVRPSGRNAEQLKIEIDARLTGLVARFTGLPLSEDEISNWGGIMMIVRAHPNGVTHDPTCGQVVFKTHPFFGRCAYPGAGRRLDCESPPPFRTCRYQDVDGAVRCAVQEVAHAQELYFVEHGEYVSGACDQLPGIELSPDLDCTTIGDAINFVVITSSPLQHYNVGCFWDSVGVPNFSCF